MNTDTDNPSSGGEEKNTRTAEIELRTHEIPTKTATPLHTVDWYIKWVSSIVLICGMILAANNLYPYNIIVQRWQNVSKQILIAVDGLNLRLGRNANLCQLNKRLQLQNV